MIRVAAVSGTQQHPSPVPYTHRPDKGKTGGGVSPYFPTLTPSHKPEALDGFHALYPNAVWAPLLQTCPPDDWYLLVRTGS